jgi:hypothetical protein
MNNEQNLLQILLQMVRGAKSAARMLDRAEVGGLSREFTDIAERLGFIMAGVAGSDMEDITESNAKGYFDGEYDE